MRSVRGVTPIRLDHLSGQDATVKDTRNAPSESTHTYPKATRKHHGGEGHSHRGSVGEVKVAPGPEVSAHVKATPAPGTIGEVKVAPVPGAIGEMKGYSRYGSDWGGEKLLALRE